MFQVKITSNNEEMLRAAVEQFIGKTDKEIQVATSNTSIPRGINGGGGWGEESRPLNFRSISKGNF